MPERTQRGEEDRKHEGEEQMMTGEPVGAATAGAGGNVGTQAPNTTRDKGARPADDNQRGADKKS